MIKQTHALPVVRQCQLLGLSHSTAYYRPTPVSAADLELMRRMGLEGLHRKPRTSHQHLAHTIYLSLLRDLTIRCSNHAWAADITYIPMARGSSSICSRGSTGPVVGCWRGGCPTWHPDQYGRNRVLARQRVCGTTLEEHQL